VRLKGKHLTKNRYTGKWKKTKLTKTTIKKYKQNKNTWIIKIKTKIRFNKKTNG
jgi:hypothetical protein